MDYFKMYEGRISQWVERPDQKNSAVAVLAPNLGLVDHHDFAELSREELRLFVFRKFTSEVSSIKRFTA